MLFDELQKPDIFLYCTFIAPRKPVPKANLDAMIAESMKDINVEEVSDGEDDPELLVQIYCPLFIIINCCNCMRNNFKYFILL